ncbi:MAG: type I asparaginase [Trueperaceae bacterium]
MTDATEPAPRRRVALLHTGGTVGMVRGDDGAYAPRAGALAQALARLPELHDPRLPDVRLEELDTLLDSSDVRPADWQRFADRIAAALEDGAHGVVVLHGTDTMAYAASALAFLLDGLPGPVVVTGSQVPLAELRSDARDNLITSLLLAATPGWAEVAVYLGGDLLRGCRTTKVSTHGFDAFESPNLPPLADVGVDVTWRHDLLRRPARGALRVHRLADVDVVALRLFPGITAETLRNVLRDPVRGLVLETYGSGNAPSRDPELLAVVRDAVARGLVVVNVTQCLRGSVRMGTYAAGRALADAGVVSGGDLTAEAALAKLLVLLSQGLAPSAVAADMVRDLAGERTPEPA